VRAEDRKLIAFLKFVGPSGEGVRREVMQLAAAHVRIASSAKLDGRSIRDFAVEHGLDLVVQGTVRERERGYRIRICVLRGTTGRPIAGVTANVPQAALDDETRWRVERGLVRALTNLRHASASSELPAAVMCAGVSP
jgi:hypothetical protein